VGGAAATEPLYHNWASLVAQTVKPLL